MKKIPTLFVRGQGDGRYVTDEVTPGCEWVIAGEGVATRKYDGTCVMTDDACEWWARREVKPGKTPPSGWVEVAVDEATGKRVGWEPIEQSSFYKFWLEAWDDIDWTTGTYELCGPKINGNPEHFDHHVLIAHDDHSPNRIVEFNDLTFNDLRHAFRLGIAPVGWEGVVWHHPDGRMAKLKVRDFAPATHPTAPVSDVAASKEESV